MSPGQRRVFAEARPTCPPGEMQCRNGMCVNEAWRCDGDDDCEDGDDERDCRKSLGRDGHSAVTVTRP